MRWINIVLGNEKAEIEWVVSSPWKGSGEGCRNETQLREPEMGREHQTVQHYKSRERCEQRLGQVGELPDEI